MVDKNGQPGTPPSPSIHWSKAHSGAAAPALEQAPRPRNIPLPNPLHDEHGNTWFHYLAATPETPPQVALHLLDCDTKDAMVRAKNVAGFTPIEVCLAWLNEDNRSEREAPVPITGLMKRMLYGEGG